MKSQPMTKTVRRSVALPQDVVVEAVALAPLPLRDNFNRLVITALKEYVARQKALAFEEAMGRMAADPAIWVESEKITREFKPAELDGLESKDDSTRSSLFRQPKSHKRAGAK
jgi:hypothetical protein